MNCTHGTVTFVEFDKHAAFTCDICLEAGYGSHYQCTNGCNYTLHQDCATTCSRTRRPMTAMICTHSTVTAVEFDNHAAFTCDSCLEMGYGSRYQCTKGCDYTLHEECVTTSSIAHHPMTVMNCTHSTVIAVEFDNHAAFICDTCFEMGYGSRYQCTNGCDYTLHQECATASPIAHHPFFSQSFSLQRQESPNTSNLCIACGMSVKGLRYCQTKERGSIYLHPFCMKMPHSTKRNDGDTLFLKKKLVTVECKYCESTSLEGRICGWAYVSSDEELACHIKCMKEMFYQEWSMYQQQEEEEEEEAYGGPEFDEDVTAGPSVALSSPSRPVASSQQTQQYHNAEYHNASQPEHLNYGRDMTTTRPAGYHYAGPLQYSVPMTTNPTSQKRRLFWELSKSTASLLFDVTLATVDPISAITAFSDLL